MSRSQKFSAMKRALGAKSGNSAKLGSRPPVEGTVALEGPQRHSPQQLETQSQVRQ